MWCFARCRSKCFLFTGRISTASQPPAGCAPATAQAMTANRITRLAIESAQRAWENYFVRLLPLLKSPRASLTRANCTAWQGLEGDFLRLSTQLIVTVMIDVSK